MTLKERKKELKELNAEIQVCPDCGKVDAYKNDRHICNREYREAREENLEYYD